MNIAWREWIEDNPISGMFSSSKKQWTCQNHRSRVLRSSFDWMIEYELNLPQTTSRYFEKRSWVWDQSSKTCEQELSPAPSGITFKVTMWLCNIISIRKLNSLPYLQTSYNLTKYFHFTITFCVSHKEIVPFEFFAMKKYK